MDEEGNFLTVKCDYDFMGRRVFKKVISGTGTVTSHHPPPQTLSAIARRACYACLSSQSGNAAESGCDLTKNVCEIFGATGYIRTAYTPFGEVTATGNLDQPIQWSSEMYDDEIKLVYYNYRHYIPFDGRWIGRDKVEEDINKHLFKYINTHN